MYSKKEGNIIVFLSSYIPRKCGIATFTNDLTTAIDNLDLLQLKCKLVVINDDRQINYCSDDVLFQIRDNKTEDYINAAHIINKNQDIKAVSIQHEFKLYGSDYGENLLSFLEIIKKPVVTTLHTVLPHPSEHRKKIVQSIAEKSDYLVIMSKLAIGILRRDYSIPQSKIIFIPHGIHDVPYGSNNLLKKDLGYPNKILLVSFGLLRHGNIRYSSGKGYEYVLDALPQIIKKFPNLLYLIIGRTHPLSIKKEGETYRRFLEYKLIELGLEKHARFINEYVDLSTLLKYLKAADVYICSSLNPHQISSGTLSYARGCGCAVISTPFAYAKEFVTSDRGILLDDFRQPELFKEAIIKLLSNPNLRHSMGEKAYLSTRHMIWPKVAASYVQTFGSRKTKRNIAVH